MNKSDRSWHAEKFVDFIQLFSLYFSKVSLSTHAVLVFLYLNVKILLSSQTINHLPFQFQSVILALD